MTPSGLMISPLHRLLRAPHLFLAPPLRLRDQSFFRSIEVVFLPGDRTPFRSFFLPPSSATFSPLSPRHEEGPPPPAADFPSPGICFFVDAFPATARTGSITFLFAFLHPPAQLSLFRPIRTRPTFRSPPQSFSGVLPAPPGRVFPLSLEKVGVFYGMEFFFSSPSQELPLKTRFFGRILLLAWSPPFRENGLP